MDFIKDILAEQGSEMIGGLVSKVGLSTEQATAFVPEAASSVFDVVKDKAGDLDLSDLGSSAGSVVDGVDIGVLAQKVGINGSQAKSALAAIVPMLLGAMQQKAGGLGGLTSLLGGKGVGDAVSGLGGMAGKLFGK